MSIRPVSFAPGEYYHLYNRGVDKRNIFLDKKDYKRFIALLYACNSAKKTGMKKLGRGLASKELFNMDRGEPLVDIIVYCPMPNHFHILIRERVEGGASTFMQRVCTAYAKYFNRKYERTGSLFEGKFKAKHVDSEAYFMWLFVYIHLNPVKLIDPDWKENGIRDIEAIEGFMKEYEYSSYYDHFLGKRPERAILNFEAMPEYAQNLDGLKDLVMRFNADFLYRQG